MRVRCATWAGHNGCVQELGVLFNFRLFTVWQPTPNRLHPGLSSLVQNLHDALRP